jgi:hypothetical protein
LLALSQLHAQNQSHTINLKLGDWFETDLRISNAAHTFNYNFVVKYEVLNKASDGNLDFKVSIERMILKRSATGNNWLGYDSYYPPYLENRKNNLSKQIYEITADGRGKISKVKSILTAQKINFSLIGNNTTSSVPKVKFSTDSIFPISRLKLISEEILSSLLVGKGQFKTLELSNSNSGNDIVNAVLKSGSFKLPRNAVIKGNIANLSRNDSIYAVNDEIFRFKKDGSFNADVLAGLNTRRRWIFGDIDNFKTFSILLCPSDTLIVKADALDFDKTVSFAGNAAIKASLSKDLVSVYDNQWINKSNFHSKSPQEFLSFQIQGEKDLDGIINKYAGRVSPELLDYCRLDFKYVQAGTKLMYLTEYQNN